MGPLPSLFFSTRRRQSTTWIPLVAIAALVLLLTACETRKTMTPDPALLEAHQTWVNTRERQLRNPEGWLALVGLVWLEPGNWRLGNSSPAELVFSGSNATSAGMFEVVGNTVSFTPEVGVEATLNDEPLAPGVEVDLVDDQHGPASVLRVGTLHITHIHRQSKPALRVRDRNAPTLTNFMEMDRHDFDPAWRVPARFTPAGTTSVVTIEDVTGHVEEQPYEGTLQFELPGDTPETTRTLIVQAAGPRDFFVVFGDASNGHETYGGGRFLQVPRPGADGMTIIDFNRAYTPPCSFTPYATCPVPPMGNRLDRAVPAGERFPQSR